MASPHGVLSLRPSSTQHSHRSPVLFLFCCRLRLAGERWLRSGCDRLVRSATSEALSLYRVHADTVSESDELLAELPHS